MGAGWQRWWRDTPTLKEPTAYGPDDPEMTRALYGDDSIEIRVKLYTHRTRWNGVFKIDPT